MPVSGWQQGRVRVVVIDRPDRANAIDLDTAEALAATFDALEVVTTAVELAERLTANGPLAGQASKRVARATLADGEAAGWAVNGELAAAVTRSEDAAEADRAASEKRTPAWSAR